MQIASLGSDHREWTASDTHSGDTQPTMDKEQVWAVAGAYTFFTCGGKGHIAKDCPSKGKGKGFFLKGSSKGFFSEQGREKGGKNQGCNGKGGQGGEGNGPVGRCWTCNKPYFAAECPRMQQKSFPFGEWFAEGWNDDVKELAKSLSIVEPNDATRDGGHVSGSQMNVHFKAKAIQWWLSLLPRRSYQVVSRTEPPQVLVVQRQKREAGSLKLSSRP